MLSKKGHLDLGEGEELHVRLKSTGYMAVLGGREVRLVGKLRGYHRLPSFRRNVACRWNNCTDFCEKGYPRMIRYETLLLLETENGGLEERVAFLTGHEHALFAACATVLEAEGRDPRDARLYYRHKVGTKRTVEVGFLP